MALENNGTAKEDPFSSSSSSNPPMDLNPRGFALALFFSYLFELWELFFLSLMLVLFMFIFCFCVVGINCRCMKLQIEETQ